MKTILITTLAVGLIGCTSTPRPQIIMRIVDPYSLLAYELTNAPCPYQFNNYPYAFTYQGTLQGCYRIAENQSGIYFISSVDWKTRVKYSTAQLMESKRVYEMTQGQALQSFTPSYTPRPPVPQSEIAQPRIQCFSNGAGTITCN